MKSIVKKYVSVCLILAIVAIIVGFISPTLKSNANSKKMTRIDFLTKVVKELGGKASANDSMFKGKVLKITEASSGKVTVAGKSTTAVRVKKYMAKYDITLKQAQVMAEAISMGLIKPSTWDRVKSYINRSDAAIILAKANEIVFGQNNCADGKKLTDEDIQLVIGERITDIQKIKLSTNRIWFAKAYLYGYMSGKSDGAYSHTRTFRVKSYPTGETLDEMIACLFDQSKRVSLSSDWQVCRMTKLPKTAKYYKYIVDSFPNGYYDTGFNGLATMGSKFFNEGFETKLIDRVGLKNFCFVFPYELEEFNALPYPSDIWGYQGAFQNTSRNDEIPSDLVKSSVEFYTYALNVNYKTIKSDKKWREVMHKYMDESEIDAYIENCIKNKTIIECDKVAADVSACYWWNDEYNCKVYAHFRVVSDEQLMKGNVGAGVDEKYGTLYPVRTGRELGDRYSRITLGPTYMKYKIGEWTDYYFNTNAESDMYGYLNTSCTTWDIMTDYTGDYPWLLELPFRSN